MSVFTKNEDSDSRQAQLDSHPTIMNGHEVRMTPRSCQYHFNLTFRDRGRPWKWSGRWICPLCPSEFDWKANIWHGLTDSLGSGTFRSVPYGGGTHSRAPLLSEKVIRLNIHAGFLPSCKITLYTRFISDNPMTPIIPSE